MAATQGDGTLFHPNSFQAEDIVKLCMGLGQVHPKGCYGSEKLKWHLHSDVALM